MQTNIGSGDKAVRVVVGLIIIGLGAYYRSWWGVIGLVPLITAALGWCPAYASFGMSTCSTRGQQEAPESEQSPDSQQQSAGPQTIGGQQDAAAPNQQDSTQQSP